MERNLQNPLFRKIGALADRMGVRAWVIGGYVRDRYLYRPLNDVDIVVLGSGIDLAQELANQENTNLTVFKNFGTAMLRIGDLEVEFVGARKESYRADSRKPIVEDGTLEDDQMRRDFTINAMAFGLNIDNFGELLDPFGGMGHLEEQIIKTPLEPDTTFSDDPLRMMRAIRFAAQLNFDIDPETFASIARNVDRIQIVSRERITTEIQKIMTSNNPSRGWMLLDECGLLTKIMPQLSDLKGVEKICGRSHKDNFLHTMQVLTNIASQTDNIWLRWAALLHDIAKPATKRWDPSLGWTFHGHEVLGSKMAARIFREQKLPLGEPLSFVQKMIFLHLRPIILSEDEVTDSAVRRLLFEAGEDIDSLMTLCQADITSKNDEKVKRYLANFALVRQKLIEIEEKDRVRNFQPPVSGDLIMATYGIAPCQQVGQIKQAIKDAIMDGAINNDYESAYAMMERLAAEYGFEKIQQ